jgi:hypothetical protein
MTTFIEKDDMRNLKNKRIWVILGSLLLSLLLAQRGQTPVRSPKPSPDWSRGNRVGVEAVGSPSIVASPDDETFEMVWPIDAGEGQQSLHYARLNQVGVLIDEHDLNVSSLQVRIPRLLPAAEGKLHLFWESREISGGKWSLWYALLDGETESLSAPTLISAPDVDMKGYHLAGDGDGGAFVVWETIDGLSGAHLDVTGSLDVEPLQITTSGESPFIHVEDGDIFLVWWSEQGVRFQRFDEKLETVERIVVAKPRLSGSDDLSGPVLGIADGWAYLAWSIRRQTGLEAGTALTEFVAFRLDQADQIDPRTIYILPTMLEPYKAYQGPYTLDQLVPPPVSAPSSSEYIYNPVPVVDPRGQFAFAVAVRQSHQNKLASQIVLVLFSEGKYIGYSQAVKTETLSASPAPMADDDGDLYLVWREGYAGSDIYYATTDPIVRANLDQLQGVDFVQALLSGLVEGLASLLLVPLLGVMWIFPGFVALAIFKMVRDMEALDTWLSWLVLAIGLISYQVIKWFSFLPLQSYVPFSAWIDVPSAWTMVLRWMVPALIFVLAIIAAEWRRRSRSCSALVYYLIVTIVDVSLTMIVYGVNVIGLG